jgi:hypothetical protein
MTGTMSAIFGHLRCVIKFPSDDTSMNERSCRIPLDVTKAEANFMPLQDLIGYIYKPLMNGLRCINKSQHRRVCVKSVDRPNMSRPLQGSIFSIIW